MTDTPPMTEVTKDPDDVRLDIYTASTATDNFFTRTSDPLALVFKDLSFTVQIKETEEEVTSEPGTPTGDGKAKRKWWSYCWPKGKKKGKIVEREKRIIDGMTGIFRPGRLTAVMGASGAGKTTLLSVLAGNVGVGHVDGQILVNGEDYSDPNKIQKISGFVFQDDILLPTMTVKEAIKMSALLRLPKEVTEEERSKRVRDIIKVLHLKRAAKTKVGNPIKKGISGGERKRTSIAMEIITNPAMLFLDEPTSGLDTFTAYAVVRALQNLAHRHGRTIVSTIHQPSSEIFYLFDDLLVLAEGKIVYYGPVTGSVDYFARLGFPCPQYTNPADFFFMNILSDIDAIEIAENAGQNSEEATSSSARRRETRPVSWIPPSITEKASDRIERLIEEWPQSDEHAEMLKLIESEGCCGGVSELSFKGHAGYATQFWFLAKRASKNAIRNKMIVRVRLFQSIFLGLILGLVYINQYQYPPVDQIRNKAGVLFFIAVNQYFASANQILAIFYEEKAVFFREFYAGYYRLSAYYWTKILVEIPYGIIFPYLLVIICYYMIGLNPAFSAYLLCGLFAVLAGFCGTATGIFIASVFDEINTALAVLPLILLPLLLFSGLFASSEALPSYLSWIQYISPIKYAYNGMVQNEFNGRQIPNCDSAVENCTPERAYTQLGLSTGLGIIPNIVFMIVIYVVLIIGAFIVLWFKVRRSKR